MNCPACGGLLRLAGNRRHFECEHCSRHHFPDETSDGVAVLETQANFACPLCSVQLHDALIEGECVVYCGQCRGFLTRTAAFGRIVTQRRAQNTATSNSHAPFDSDELRRPVSCPSCKKRMQTHAYGGGGNAVVDTCPRCDCIWLDAGELNIIGRYVVHVPRREAPLPIAPTSEPEAPSLLDWF